MCLRGSPSAALLGVTTQTDSTAWRSTAWRSTGQHRATQRNTGQHSTALHRTACLLTNWMSIGKAPAFSRSACMLRMAWRICFLPMNPFGHLNVGVGGRVRDV